MVLDKNYLDTYYIYKIQLCLFQVPKTDLFEISELPGKICNGIIKHKESGCFLTLVKRKAVLRLNDKTLIFMAEKRGLFGGKKLN